MAFRTRYRRKAPSSPEAQGLFFRKAQVSSAFFNPSHQGEPTSTHSVGAPVVQCQEGTVAPTKPEEEKPVQKQDKLEDKPVQKQATQEEEKTVQKQSQQEEEKPVQKQDKLEDKPVQKQTMQEEEKPVQKEDSPSPQAPTKPKTSTYHLSPSSEEPEEPAPLPDPLRAKIEALSGISMNDVRVYYNSRKPAQMQALAYTQGCNIYVAPGQEKHLPHEAWHVVQQKQGRVTPTLQTKGINVNNDSGLEQEATAMGQKATEPPTSDRAH